MYFEREICVQCGRQLPEGAHGFIFNAIIMPVDPSHTKYNELWASKPTFCSEICYEKEMSRRIRSFMRDRSAELATEKAELKKIQEQYDYQLNLLESYEYTSTEKERSRLYDKRYEREKEITENRAKILKEDAWSAAISAEREFSAEYFAAKVDWDRKNPIVKIGPPVEIDQQIKFEHTLCIAPSGAGKTTLMFNEILENLKKPDPPAMVIIDPKGTVMEKISKLACFHATSGVHRDRLIIIDPTDLVGPPAFNLFKPTNEARLARYDANTRLVLENKVVELLQYTFSSRNQPLTGKQAPCFAAVCRLMLKLPEPDLSLLFDILNDQQSEKKQSLAASRPQWIEAVNRLPDLSARFFKEQYFSNYTSTRDEITSRLYGVVEHPSIQAVFNARENKFDMFDALQTGKIVIVNVPNALLTSAGAELFGRYMIALTLAAAFERITIKDKSKWTPAFLYIDESQEFADENKTVELLRLAREFKLGVFMCLLNLSDHKGETLKSAVLTNTRIKYTSSVTVDAAPMAKVMQCEPEFFRLTHKSNTHVRFARFITGLTTMPEVVELPLGGIDKEPALNERAYEGVLALNRSRVSLSGASSTPYVPEPEPSSEPRQAQLERTAVYEKPQPYIDPNGSREWSLDDWVADRVVGFVSKLFRIDTPSPPPPRPPVQAAPVRAPEPPVVDKQPARVQVEIASPPQSPVKPDEDGVSHYE
jgi:hypothetical protein